MERLSTWFWIGIAYLSATVAFNIGTQWASFARYALIDQISVAANLAFKIIAILLLLARRRVGVHFLSAAFLIGLSDTVLQLYRDGTWNDLPTIVKLPRIGGFVISAAIIVYMANLARRGLLDGRRVPV